MKCTCENCKHRLDHPEGIICGNKLSFVDKNGTCADWDNEDFFDTTYLVAFTIIAIGIVLICANFL